MVDLRKHGPSVNADVIDLAEQKRRNALFVLDVLVKAYVPKNTNDWREGLAALAELRGNSSVPPAPVISFPTTDPGPKNDHVPSGVAPSRQPSCGNCIDGIPGGPDNCSKCGRDGQQYSHWTPASGARPSRQEQGEQRCER